MYLETLRSIIVKYLKISRIKRFQPILAGTFFYGF